MTGATSGPALATPTSVAVAGAARGQKASSAHRLIAVDWLRALAVLVMIECHSLVFLSAAYDQAPLRQALNAINGLAAPTFILLAGLMLAYLLGRATSTSTSNTSTSTASNAFAGLWPRAAKSLQRIGQVLLASLLLKFVSEPMDVPANWLRISILSCIGYSLVLVWLVMLAGCRHRRVAMLTLGALALAAFAAAPITHAGGDWGRWAYVLTPASGSIFPLVPWSGYALAGACVGAAASRSPRPQRAMAIGFLILAAIGLLWATAGNRLTPLYGGRSVYLITNAGERLAMLSGTLLVLLALARWMQRSPAQTHAPMRGSLPRAGLMRGILTRGAGIAQAGLFFSRRSLSAYVVHLLLLYCWPVGRQLARFYGRCNWWGWFGLMLALIAATAGVCLLLDQLAKLLPARQRAG